MIRADKRQVPGGMPKDKFVNSINSLELFIGEQWIQKPKSARSCFNDLWNRTDDLSSIELCSISEALKKFKNPKYLRWLSDYKKKIKTNKDFDIISSTYELLSAAMFYNGKQVVELCEPSFPGFDFIIHLTKLKKQIKVSCKKLQPSDEEKEFKNYCSLVYNFAKERMIELKITGIEIIVSLDNYLGTKPTFDSIKSIINNCLIDYRLFRLGNRRVGFCEVVVFPWEESHPGYGFHPNEPSIIFLCKSPFMRGEQKRLEDLFRRAATNLKKHSNGIDPNSINMIMIGLPPSISIETAKGWLSDKFERDYSSITSVLLTRCIPAMEKDLTTSIVLNEISWVTNPNANVNLIDFFNNINPDIKCIITFGKISTEESSLQLVDQNGNFIEINGHYLYQKGELNHQTLTIGPTEYSTKRIPGVSINTYIRLQPDNEIKLSFIYPPEDAFLIL